MLHRSITGRLTAGFGAVLLLLVVLTAISVQRIGQVNANLATVNDVNSVKQRYAINFRGSVHDRAIALRDVVLVRSDAERADALDQIRTLTDKYAAAAGPLDAMLTPDKAPAADETRIVADIKATEARTLPMIQRAIALREAGDGEGAWQVLMAQARPQFVTWLAQINRFIDFQENANKAVAAETRATTESFRTLLTTLCLVAVALGGAVAWWAISGVRPVARMADVMGRLDEDGAEADLPCTGRRDELGRMAGAMLAFRRKLLTARAETAAAENERERQTAQVVDTVGRGLERMSHGDLTARVDADLHGPYASLKDNFNAALANLRDLIGGACDSTAIIRTAAGEIAQASEDLARRTEGNAASLEETAASVTQIDGRLRASAGAAARTVERADQAIATVGGGRQVAEEAVAAMGRVADSAKGIDSVIEGLDKIAFQTRVLAMNAAVEAGRAGDAGRGFAVVADLVSALAMRAEEEAKRARDQLTVTQTDIVTAVDAVQKVDGALSDISGDVGQVHELLATMAADNQAQSAAITQISSAIGSMDQATQQNAAMVEETSAAARSLAAEVEGLAEQAARFNTGAAPAAPAARAPVTPARFAGPARALPAAAVPALTRAAAPADQDDWKEF